MLLHQILCQIPINQANIFVYIYKKTFTNFVFYKGRWIVLALLFMKRAIDILFREKKVPMLNFHWVFVELFALSLWFTLAELAGTVSYNRFMSIGVVSRSKHIFWLDLARMFLACAWYIVSHSSSAFRLIECLLDLKIRKLQKCGTFSVWLKWAFLNRSLYWI